MPRTKISEYSATANSNTDVAGVNVDEGCAPSGINNAIRAVMGHLKDFQVGNNGDPFNGPVNGTVGATTANTGAFTTLSASSTVSGTGFSTYLASPPAIGGTAAAAVSSTALSYTTTLTGGTGIVNIGSGQIYKDASGNVGIGTSSPNAPLDVLSNSSAIGVSIRGRAADGLSVYNFKSNDGATQYGYILGSSAELRLAQNGANYITAYTNGGERMRIDSSGNLLVGTTSASQSADVGLKLINSTTLPVYRVVVNTSNSADAGIVFANTNATNGGFRFYVTANGGIYNYSGNNVNLSDERTKTNIEVAGGYLDKICAIPVKLFNYKDEAEGEQRTLGVIAQDVEAVAPEFVNQNGWIGEAPEGEDPLKSIYTTDMMFALMKAIQELKAINDTQAQAITTLTERITALEAK
jgi:hypothetical protein